MQVVIMKLYDVICCHRICFVYTGVGKAEQWTNHITTAIEYFGMKNPISDQNFDASRINV